MEIISELRLSLALRLRLRRILKLRARLRLSLILRLRTRQRLRLRLIIVFRVFPEDHFTLLWQTEQLFMNLSVRLLLFREIGEQLLQYHGSLAGS